MKRTGWKNNVPRGILTFAALAAATLPTYAGGEGEAGRDQAFDMIRQDRLVAPVMIDAEAFLDDYDFPYDIAANSPITIVAEVDQPVVMDTGATVTLQVAVGTSSREFFPQRAFNYVLVIDDPAILEESAARTALSEELRTIARDSRDDVSLFLYAPLDGELVAIDSHTDVETVLDDLIRQATGDDRDGLLRDVLIAAESIQNQHPIKYLWVIGKPVAEDYRDLGDLTSILQTHLQPFAEVSFAGYGESFRAATINPLIASFGGSSYFFDQPTDIGRVVRDNYRSYRTPAVDRLRVHVFEASVRNEPLLLRTFNRVAMGPGEHHTFHIEMRVPSQFEYTVDYVSAAQSLHGGTASTNDAAGRLQREYPLATIVYEYFDHASQQTRFGQTSVTTRYTHDYAFHRRSVNVRVERNELILQTAGVLGQVGGFLSSQYFGDALGLLTRHIEALERFHRENPDDEIAEDIESLWQYRTMILELMEDPTRNRRIRTELRRRTY